MTAPLPPRFSANVPPVPVFNCVLHVAAPNPAGMVVARAANLNGIVGQGRTQREAIASAVAAFKAAVTDMHAQGATIPFNVNPEKPAPGETELLIAVHL